MSEQIASIIEKYLSNQKSFDKEFANEVLANLLTDELKPICSNNHVFTYNNPFFGTGNSMEYSYPNGINIYIENSNRELTEIITNYASIIKYNYNFNIDNEVLIKELEYFYYLQLVIMMSHEVEHVKQNYNYNNDNTLEEFLTRLNLYTFRKYEELKRYRTCEDKEFRDSLGDFYKYKSNNDEIKYIEPIERYAHINSTKKIKSIIIEVRASDEVKEVLYFLVDYISRFHYIYSYGTSKEEKSPLKAYINYLKKYDLYKLDNLTGEEIDEKIMQLSENLSLEDRLNNGLSISDSEYKNIRNEKIKIL